MRWCDGIQVRTALWFTVASVLPLATLTIILQIHILTTLETSARRDNRVLVDGIRDDVETRLEFLREQFIRLAHTPEVQSMHRLSHEEEARRFMDYHPVFFKTMTFDAEGAVTAITWRSRYQGDQQLVGSSVATHDPVLATAVESVIENGETLTTEPVIDAFSQAIVYVVTPIVDFIDENIIIGAIAGGIQVYGNQFQQLIDQARLPADGFALITDTTGNVVAGRGSFVPPYLKTFPLSVDGIVVNALEDEQGQVEGRLIVDGRDMLAIMAPVAGSRLRLIVGRPWDEIRDPAIALAWRMLWFTLAGVVLAIVLGLVLARSFVGPLAEFVKGVRLVGSGQLAHRVQIERDDELGLAVAAFNDLAADLEKRRLVEDLWTGAWNEP